MAKYECMYIIKPDVNEDTLKSTREKIAKIIEDHSGEILDAVDMGKKRLAYEINDLSEGFYNLLTFNSTPEVVSELDRIIKIDENVMRHMTTNIS